MAFATAIAGTRYRHDPLAPRGRLGSVEDGEMLHGRKSRSVRFDGYTRHQACLRQGR